MRDGTDTIAAIATPPGRGGIGIVRVSGPGVTAIADALLGGLPAPRRASLHAFADAGGDIIDNGLAIYFPAPHSFTGEAVLELHGHGGAVVMDLLLGRVLELGARPARPGEFSERAFHNDKLDLAQAEAIADLIDSGSSAAARAAVRSLQGEFSNRIHALVEALTRLRMYVEAAIDFAEEEIDFLADAALGAQFDELRTQFDAVEKAARQGALLREGMTLVIAGRPNVGKSSLLNRLAGYDAAIVTEIPGTTRDVLRERIEIDGLPVHVIDTAGLRDSTDVVEAEGIRRARNEIARADVILLLIDDCSGIEQAERDILAQLPPGPLVIIVRNKIDLSGGEPGVRETADRPEVLLSAKTGAGVDALRAHLRADVGYTGADSDSFLARRRHLDALQQARAHLDTGAEHLRGHQAGELLAEELRLAQQVLATITGEFTSDDLLARIFAEFCIGK